MFAAIVLVLGLIVIVPIVVKVWPFISNGVAIVNTLVKLPELVTKIEGFNQGLTALKAQVSEIHHETHRNDGSSIKDLTVRIEESLRGLHGRMDAVESDTKEIRAQIDVLKREDDAIWKVLDDTQPDEPDYIDDPEHSVVAGAA